MNDIIDYIHTNRDRYVEELKAYLAIPSISALPQHAGDVRRCAEWTADEMGRIGLNNVRLIETPGNPVVYGDWLGAEGAPTILFYGHYDVQPVDPLELWESPPFEATIRDGEIYARGSADDKGQVFMHFKAIEAHLKKTGKLPVNMKIILEGEEEVGSANLDNFIKAHQSELAADVVVISDSPMFDRGVPSICYGLRGLVYCQLDLRGTKSDLHSGSFGGAVANPAMVLAQILAQMKDRGGRIKVPGFYDAVRPLRDEERAEWKRLPFNETRYRKELGAPKLFGESGYTTLERTWARPTLEVNGLLAGFTGEGAKTVIPAVSMAKVSMRLVPDQDPDTIAKLFEDYVRKITPKTVEVKVTRMHGGKPWMTDFDNPFVQAAGRAIEKGFGKTPVFNREGGSIPVVATFQEILRLPSVLFGVGLPDENAHAPNEKLDLGNFHGGIVASAFLYDEMAKTRGRCIGCCSPWLAVGGAILAHGCADPERERLKQTTKASYDQATGKLTELTYDANKNGRIDTWTEMDGTRPLRSRIDSNEDGRIDRWEYYDAGRAPRQGGLLEKGGREARRVGVFDRVGPDRSHRGVVDWRSRAHRSLGVLRYGRCRDGRRRRRHRTHSAGRRGHESGWPAGQVGALCRWPRPGRRVRREPRRPSRPPPDLPRCRAGAD